MRAATAPIEEVKAAWALEPLLRVREYLAAAGAWTEADEQALINDARADRSGGERILAGLEALDRCDVRASCSPNAAASAEQRDTPRIYGTKAGGTSSGPSSGHSLAKVTMVEAIAMAHGWEMQHDERVVVLGQDVGVNGGVFRATAGLQARFGRDRVQDTPLAEAAIAGMSRWAWRPTG